MAEPIEPAGERSLTGGSYEVIRRRLLEQAEQLFGRAEDLNQRRNEELQALLQRAQAIVRQIAEQEKYDLIVQDAVYFSPRVDITDKVLRVLNNGK